MNCPFSLSKTSRRYKLIIPHPPALHATTTTVHRNRGPWTMSHNLSYATRKLPSVFTALMPISWAHSRLLSYPRRAQSPVLTPQAMNRWCRPFPCTLGLTRQRNQPVPARRLLQESTRYQRRLRCASKDLSSATNPQRHG